MNIETYLQIVYKNLRLIILIPLLIVSITVIFCKFIMKPVYESTQSFYVINSSYFVGGYDSVMVDQQLLKDYRELIKSNYITNIVLETLLISNVSQEDLKKRVSVELKNETRFLEIKVQDTDPAMARVLNETFGEVFVSQVKTWMDVESISIIDRADIPIKPVKPNTKMYMLVAAIIGFMAAVGIIFFKEYLDDTVKSIDEVEQYMSTEVLGTIPEFKIR